MARFATDKAAKSPKKTAAPKRNTRTTNLAGGKAYTQGAEEEVASILMTSLLKDQFYEGAQAKTDRLGEALSRVDPKFAAQAAVMARQEHGIRSITHVLAADIVHLVKGEEWVKDFIFAVVARVDDMTEITAAYIKKYGKPLPNSLKKGLAKSFNKFDRYQLAKYRGEGHAITLVDLVNLVHPVPTDRNRDALRDLVAGTLRSEGTAQVALSAAGKLAKTDLEKKELKKDAWKDLLSSGKIGYQSLVMNLRNIQETGDKALIQTAADLLVDPERVHGSRLLPFQFLRAYPQVSSIKLRNALNKAVETSVANMPQIPGRNLIAVDHSGSMSGGWDNTPTGYLSPLFTADLFGAMLLTKTDADFMIFGTDARYVLDVNDGEGIISMAESLGRLNHPPGGHGTNANRIFDRATKSYDRVFIFSDMQSWEGDRYYGTSTQTAFDQYKVRTGADPFVYSFDLAGHGTSLFNMDGRVAQIPGLSEKVFQLVGAVEEDRAALVHKIKAIDFKTYRRPKG